MMNENGDGGGWGHVDDVDDVDDVDARAKALIAIALIVLMVVCALWWPSDRVNATHAIHRRTERDAQAFESLS